jgi:hypothetical protein
MDIWIASDSENAQLISAAMQSFGYSAARVPPKMFQEPDLIFICGREPLRIDLLTNPKGLEFEECYARRRTVIWDDIPISLIALDDLRKTKTASGRAKDLADLENLPADESELPLKKPRRRKRE